MAHLLEAAAARGLKVFFLGAKEEVVQKLVRWCESRYPGLIVAGYRNGYFKESDYPEVINQVRRSGADMLFVGMPTPFKEVWCKQNREALGVPVIMGVGGSFDVLAGFIRRAPLWMQNAGLEWFWRLLMEPRKMWKRYLVTNSIFIVRTLLETMRRRSVSGSQSATF
jgi:N-acetylglucosaminyldiphosphoundecaprenol N-acetyl-beta-D-mannosaminyltransferase